MLDLPDTKPFFERLFLPMARFLGRRGVRPNTLTLTSISISAISGLLGVAYATAAWPFTVIMMAMLARLALNHIDGIIARGQSMKTPLGGLLNEIATPAEDMLLYLPLAARPGMPAPLTVCAVMAGVLVEVAGLSPAVFGGPRRCDGPMTKFMRGLFFGALTLASALDLAMGPWAAPALALIVCLLAVTLCNRLRRSVLEAAS
jgi:CDP-diacylglycerol--glycerol-3-phosphate 3-phosphatidyltransferase